MEMKKIISLAEEGQISKRVCKQLMREKLFLLRECQELLEQISECEGIHIYRDSVVYEGNYGARLLFDFEEHPVCRAEMMLCRSEWEDWGFIESLIPELGTILDIGANVGWFSIQLAKRYPRTKIYAFEPVASTYAQMQKNLDLNGLTSMSSRGGQVTTVNAGLYDKDGESTIYVPGSSEASSLQPVDDTFYLRESQEGQMAQSCQIKTMDTFVREQKLDRLDFIKCDTEGAEKMVFDGASWVLREFKPIVYTEMLRKHAKRFGYHPNEIIELFHNFGYDCYREENSRLILFKAMNDNTNETNFLFLHRKNHVHLIEKYTFGR